MNKTKKRFAYLFIGVILCLFLVLGLALPIFSAMPTLCAPLTAQADDSTEGVDVSKLNLLDSNYEWTNGASIYKGEEENPDKFLRSMRFRFNIINTDIFKLTSTGTGEEADYATYEFTIYRNSAQGQIPIYQIGILSYYGLFIVGHKRLAVENVGVTDTSFRPGAIRFMPDPCENEAVLITLTEENIEEGTEIQKQLYEQAKIAFSEVLDYTLDYVSFTNGNKTPFFTAEENGVPYIDVVLEINSPTTEYFVTAKSQIRWYEKTIEVKKDTWLSAMTGSLFSWLFKETEQKAIYKGEEYDSLIKSPTRSVLDVLEALESAGTLEKVFTSETALTQVKNLLTNTTTETVQVSYLEQIGKTPFAKKVTKTVTVPVNNDEIFYDDVSDALDGKSLNCLGASVNGFTRDSYGNYEANYLSSTRVEAKTVDGNRTDYFLNLDKTFKEFYSGIASEGAFNDGLYSFMLNGIKQNYPAVTSYAEDEIYGLWGYVVVPQTTTFHSIFKDVFQTPTEWTGSLFDYSIEGSLNVSTYTALLREHGYSWLETIWQTAITGITNAWSLPATHYLFYADPKFKEVNIGENGGELGDESGAINEMLSEIAGKAVDSASKAIEENARTVRMVLATVLIISMGFAIAYGIISLRKYNEK